MHNFWMVKSQINRLHGRWYRDAYVLRYWSRIVNMISVRKQWLIDRAPAPRWAQRRPLCIPIFHTYILESSSGRTKTARKKITTIQVLMRNLGHSSQDRGHAYVQRQKRGVLYVCMYVVCTAAQQPPSCSLTSLLQSELWAVSSPYWCHL